MFESDFIQSILNSPLSTKLGFILVDWHVEILSSTWILLVLWQIPNPSPKQTGWNNEERKAAQKISNEIMIF